MKIPQDLFSQYPETIKGQCIHWRNLCGECGTRFTGVKTTCETCASPRVRCKNAAMKGEDSCRVHMRARTYNIFTLATQQVADGQLEALIEGDDRDLAQEYQLVRYVIAQQAEKLLDPEKTTTDKDVKNLVLNMNTFFKIAERRKKIEDGEQLNISIDDESRRYIQARMKSLVACFKEALEAHIPEESIRLAIMSHLRENSRLPGNKRTIVPMHRNKKAEDLARGDATLH